MGIFKSKPQSGRVLKGSPLHVSVSIAARMQATIDKHVSRMVKETERDIRKLFEADDYSISYGMDANIGSQARMMMNSLYRKFNAMFGKVAQPAADKMTEQAEKNSAATLKSSLDATGALEIPMSFITPTIKEIVKGSAYEAAHLIKRVPAKYLDNIANSVFRAITEGKGLADIQPMLEQQNVSVRNWAKNVSMDQTRKCYNNLNRERMESVGIEEYDWMHSHGSNHPRKYHRDVLDNTRQRWDSPPWAEPSGTKNRHRAHPGELSYCRCVARPVINFSKIEG